MANKSSAEQMWRGSVKARVRSCRPAQEPADSHIMLAHNREACGSIRNKNISPPSKALRHLKRAELELEGEGAALEPLRLHVASQRGSQPPQLPLQLLPPAQRPERGLVADALASHLPLCWRGLMVGGAQP